MSATTAELIAAIAEGQTVAPVFGCGAYDSDQPQSVEYRPRVKRDPRPWFGTGDALRYRCSELTVVAPH